MVLINSVIKLNVAVRLFIVRSCVGCCCAVRLMRTVGKAARSLVPQMGMKVTLHVVGR